MNEQHTRCDEWIHMQLSFRLFITEYQINIFAVCKQVRKIHTNWQISSYNRRLYLYVGWITIVYIFFQSTQFWCLLILILWNDHFRRFRLCIYFLFPAVKNISFCVSSCKSHSTAKKLDQNKSCYYERFRYLSNLPVD